MADIAPLKPLRYDLNRLANNGGLASVVAPPYDVIDAQQRAELAARHPYNIVKLILPEGDGDAKYAHAADLYNAWRQRRRARPRRRAGVLSLRPDLHAAWRRQGPF